MSLSIDLPFTSFTLSNGLNVIVHEDHSVPIAAVNLWYRVGSKDERPGRTGFAHLFEHLMFEGSLNVPGGVFDELLESVGGINNGSTSTDRTNYWETVPSNALDLALFLESDRMGWLADTMSQDKLDAQRDVVKNERRQSYENRPYGLAWETLFTRMYPVEHPYHWPIIGWMPDLDAATLDDVIAFFRSYYAPGNASLCIAGAVDTAHVRERVEHWFGEIPAGPALERVASELPTLSESRCVGIEDDVHLPRLYIGWHTPPILHPGDAELDVLGSVLSQGKASRLYRRLVYELAIAQDVEAFQSSALLGSTFCIVVTARPGITLDRIAVAVWNELHDVSKLVRPEEVERAVNRLETGYVDALQSVGGFGGRADRLNHYAYYANDPGYLMEDLGRYRRLVDNDIMRAAGTFLREAPCVALSVVPRGKSELILEALP